MYKVLIVDDEFLERRALNMILTTKIKDINIIGEAENGRKAIELAKQLSPDVILMDIKMPGIDGIEAVRAIKKYDATIKIIMLSAFDRFEYARQVMQQGVKEYLLKPARKDEIVGAVLRVLSEIKKERQEREEQEILLEKLKSTIDPSENEEMDWSLITDDRTMKKAKQFIEENYTKAISLEDAAEYVGLSPYYLSKIFKEQFSVNFIDYVTQLRVEKAKDLMKDPDQSLKEICFTIGYKDPNYFSRVFKKTTGHSPSDFRRRGH